MKRVVICFFVIISCFACTRKISKKENAEKPSLFTNIAGGKAFGTTYSVTFIDSVKRNYKKSYDSLVNVINQSMSTYQEETDITRINNGDTTVQIDSHFKKVFLASKEVYKNTNGVYDPTIGVIVNAWGFGPEGEIESLDSLKIEKLLETVGLDKVQLKEKKILKEHKETRIDFNAIAKGYAVDVFYDFLESKGHQNYLVEIGGEIRTKGRNTFKKNDWTVGIEDPNFDGSISYSKIITLSNEAMATSGSYRKFKVDENGKRYAHIIDTKTGYPSKTNVLSVSVIADNCMLADAYATTFKSMGIEKVKRMLATHSELKVYFIYEDANKELKKLALNGFPE